MNSPQKSKNKTLHRSYPPQTEQPLAQLQHTSGTINTESCHHNKDFTTQAKKKRTTRSTRHGRDSSQLTRTGSHLHNNAQHVNKDHKRFRVLQSYRRSTTSRNLSTFIEKANDQMKQVHVFTKESSALLLTTPPKSDAMANYNRGNS
jgi:hypothetical protein